MSLARLFMRDSAIYAIPAIVSRGISFFLLPVYTRILAPADYGAFDMFLAFAALVQLTVALEISQGLARHYADAPDAKAKTILSSTALWFTVAAYSFFLLIGLLSADYIAPFIMGAPGHEAAFGAGLVYLWFAGIFYLVQNQFRWELKSKSYAAVSMLMSLVAAGASIFLAAGLGLGIEGILWGMAAGCAAGCAYGVWHLRESFRPVFSRDNLSAMLGFSLPLVPSGIAVFVSYYIDRLMIQHFLSLDDVGVYGIAFRLAGVIALVLAGFQGAVTPLILAHYKDEATKRHLADIFRLFTGAALMVVLGLSLFAREILWVLTTPAYYAAAHVVPYLAAAMLLSNMYIFAPGLTLEKKTRAILGINFFGALLNIILNFIMVPMFGIMGAACATMISYGCVFAVYMAASQKLYPVPHGWSRLCVAAGVIMAMAIAGNMMDFGQGADILIKAVVVMAGAGVIFMLRLIRREDIEAAGIRPGVA